MHDEQLIVVVTDAQRKRQLAEPVDPFLAEVLARPCELRLLDRFERFVRRIGEIAVGISANARDFQLLEALQHLFRLRPVEAKIAGGHDDVCAALRIQVGQTRVETDQIAVDVGKDGEPHRAVGRSLNRV